MPSDSGLPTGCLCQLATWWPLARELLARRDSRGAGGLLPAEVPRIPGGSGAGVADRPRERGRGVVWSRWLGQAQKARDHALHLALVGRPRAADRLLHSLRRVVEAGDGMAAR